MSRKRYNQVRMIIALFVGLTVSIAVVRDNYPLSVFGVLTGMLFMILVRSKSKIKIDEREKTVREKAAQMTYAIFTPVIGFVSVILTFAGRNSLYLSALGQVLAYLVLFLIALYAVSYHFVNKKLGGSTDEE